MSRTVSLFSPGLHWLYSDGLLGHHSDIVYTSFWNSLYHISMKKKTPNLIRGPVMYMLIAVLYQTNTTVIFPKHMYEHRAEKMAYN